MFISASDLSLSTQSLKTLGKRCVPTTDFAAGIADTTASFGKISMSGIIGTVSQMLGPIRASGLSLLRNRLR